MFRWRPKGRHLLNLVDHVGRSVSQPLSLRQVELAAVPLEGPIVGALDMEGGAFACAQ
jgi:hypothetical protein